MGVGVGGEREDISQDMGWRVSAHWLVGIGEPAGVGGG